MSNQRSGRPLGIISIATRIDDVAQNCNGIFQPFTLIRADSAARRYSLLRNGESKSRGARRCMLLDLDGMNHSTIPSSAESPADSRMIRTKHDESEQSGAIWTHFTAMDDFRHRVGIEHTFDFMIYYQIAGTVYRIRACCCM